MAQRGLAPFQQGITKALANFQRTAGKEKPDAEVPIHLAILYLGLKEYELAYKILQNIREKEPGHFDANVVLGHLLWEMNHREEAKRILHLVLRIQGKIEETMIEGWDGSPEDPRFHLILGDIYRKKGRDYESGFIKINGNFLPMDAMGCYAKGVAQHPHYPGYLQRVGEIYYQWKIYDLAAKYFQYSVKLDPDRPENWKYLGLSLLKCYDRENGIRALRQAYCLEPSDFLLSMITAKISHRSM